MVKIPLLVLLLLLSACGEENSSTVGLEFDGAGCLVAAKDYDWTSETVSKEGLRTVNYLWECASYLSPLTGRQWKEKQVTLTFMGTDCLRLEAELVQEGRCLQGKTPVF